MRRRNKRVLYSDVDQDLTPMVDVIFLLIIFFVLAGRITADITNEIIAVPPAKTGSEVGEHRGWEYVKIDVRRLGTADLHELRMGLMSPWVVEDIRMDGYQQLRTSLNHIYARADHDIKNNISMPRVIIELRADADVDYRVVQAIQQVATDSVDPFDRMRPRRFQAGGGDQPKPFVNFRFTARQPGG